MVEPATMDDGQGSSSMPLSEDTKEFVLEEPQTPENQQVSI